VNLLNKKNPVERAKRNWIVVIVSQTMNRQMGLRSYHLLEYHNDQGIR